MSETSGRGALITATVCFSLALALANVSAYVLYTQVLADPAFTLAGPGDAAQQAQRLIGAFESTYAQHAGFFWFFLLAPLVAGGIITLLVALRRQGARTATPAAADTDAAADTSAATTAAALRLLALLQREGRLIDFLQEDIDGYSDAQVGAAARGIHIGCSKALHEHMQIERIYQQEDGSAIEVAPGYDPALLRLTGNVHGEPPFRGTLEHGGWRAVDFSLPAATDPDASVLAPAEVEVS